MDELTARALTIGGPWALVSLAVVMVLTGRLVPRWFYDAKAREADTWRETAETNAEALRTAQHHEAELLELSRTGVHVLSSLPHSGEVTAHVSVDQAPPAPR